MDHMGGRSSVSARSLLARVCHTFRTYIARGTPLLRLDLEPEQAMMAALASSAGALTTLHVSPIACLRLYNHCLLHAEIAEQPERLALVRARIASFARPVTVFIEPFEESSLHQDEVSQSITAHAVCWLAHQLAISHTIAHVHIAWLSVNQGTDFAELLALMSSPKVEVDGCVRVSLVGVSELAVADVTPALVAMSLHPVRLLSVRVEEQDANISQLLRLTRAPHVRVLVVNSRFGLNGPIGQALAQNGTVRRVDVFFRKLTPRSFTFLHAMCTDHAYPDGLLIGISLARAKAPLRANADLVAALEGARVGASLGIHLNTMWTLEAYGALQTLLDNNPDITSLALTIADIECDFNELNLNAGGVGFGHSSDDFPLRLPVNITSASLRFKHALMIMLLGSATLEGVEALDVHLERANHDMEVDMFNALQITANALNHTLTTAPRLRHLTLRMGGTRGLLLYGVAKPLAATGRALESVTVEFDLVELVAPPGEWQAAVRRILAAGSAARSRTRWVFRVRENEMARSEELVI